MSSDSTKVTIELDDCTEVEVEITVDAYYDSNYGADADGNRGTGVWEIDDYEHEVLTKIQLSDEQKRDLFTKVEEIVFDREWDFDSNDGPDYERDDS